MSSKVNPKKLLEDIEENIENLKRYSEENSVINDDCSMLHHFENRLEYILFFGLHDKARLLGSKKSYWSYIYTCLSSSKRTHDGLNFVKSFTALKTPLGRGRAFIRYCLMQKCLADTLQICFMDKRVTKDFYCEMSIPAQEKWWSILVSSLYKLNDLNFDLNDAYSELDISWPKFARKHFLSSDQKLSHRSSSSSSLFSYFSQKEIDVNAQLDSISMDSANLSKDNFTQDRIVTYEELYNENGSLKEEVERLKEEKMKLTVDMQNLQTEFLTLQEFSKLSNRNNVVCQNCKVPISSSELPINNSTSENIENKAINEEVGLSNYIDIKSIPTRSTKVGTEIQNGISKLDDLPVKCAIVQTDSLKHFTPNSYVVELLKEMKTLIDDMEDILQKSDVTSAVSYMSYLKSLRNSIEEKITTEVKNSDSLNFTTVIEKYVNCMKNYSLQQTDIVNMLQEKVDLSIKQNQNLYSKISVLRSLLRSYGFLKQISDKDCEPKSVLPIDDALHFSKSSDEFICDNLAHDPLLKRFVVPLLPIFNSSISQLKALNKKMSELQCGLDSSQELNEHLISRVQDQELHLKGVTKELEEAQHLVSVLKKQHMKLQSAENIIKYDLQEKRKLLNRLKQQLENTREDFNLVRIKNSKTEADWQDLRKEFVLRHKQTSEESGFIDEKGFDDQSSENSESHCKYTFDEEYANSTSSLKNSSEEISETTKAPKKSRLELLEEQCQNLCSNLMKNSRRHQEIDKRLEIMCKNIEKTSSRIVSAETLTNIQPYENNSDTLNVNSESEEVCENVFNAECFMNSPHTSSDIGSLNSDCSSYLPVVSTNSNLTENFYSEQPNSEHSISCDYFTTNVKLTSINESYQGTISVPESDSTSSCASENKGSEDMLSSCGSVELLANGQKTVLANIEVSHVDSLLFKKKDLEESLKKLEINNESLSSDNTRFFEPEELVTRIASLENEKQHLVNKIQELEENNIVLSSELDQTIHKLQLSKALKDHEVSSIQFQLKEEVLKYEKALKEFGDQSEGLENMKQKVSDQEHLIQVLEEALKEIRSERENEKEQQWQDLEDFQLALEAREQECLSLSQDLEKSLTDIERERNRNDVLTCQLEELKTFTIKHRSSLEAELLHLQNDSKELRKKLIKLLKEKDILWKRNDHLFHIQKVKIDDRWMNDSEVTKCVGCQSNFSFLLRKHHCRICGRIFCYACANNWLLTAASSKQIRACNECYGEHMQLQKDIRRGSDVPQVDEDSGDETINDLSFIPFSSSSFNSEIPPSITDSLISLPITMKQSTPHFSSAPDLRFMYQLDGKSESKNVADKNLSEIVAKRFKQNDISSDECTSATLEDEVLYSPKIHRLFEIDTDEIEGVNGNFIASPGEIIELPISSKKFPFVLQWCFITNEEVIPVVIVRTDIEPCDSEPTICYHEENKMEDEIKISLPGQYVFHLDASHRTSEMKIQYYFNIKNDKDESSVYN